MASDWAGLPRHLLITIFQMVLDVHYDLIPLAQHWYALASVCRHWHETVSATPLMVELQTPEDLGAPVLRWLSQRCMESLSMRPAVDRKRRDELLLQYPEFIRRSGQDLQVLWNADLSTSLPLLPHFQNLNKVEVALPPPAPGSRLRHLAVKSAQVLVDWPALCASGCEQVELTAENLTLSLVPLAGQPGAEVREDAARSARQEARIPIPGRFPGPEPAYGALTEELTRGSVRGATLAFYTLSVAAPTWRNVRLMEDPDALLSALRSQLLGAAWDVSPTLECHPDFVGDAESPDPCHVLELTREDDAGGARSFHFTTPATPDERALVLAGPVWRLAWCGDPASDAILADPRFLAASGPTLEELTNVELRPGLSLEPFLALHTLVARVRGPDLARLALPRSLRTLTLVAWADDDEEAVDFDARELAPRLPELADLGLVGWRAHDLAALGPGVRRIRVSDPDTRGDGLERVPTDEELLDAMEEEEDQLYNGSWPLDPPEHAFYRGDECEADCGDPQCMVHSKLRMIQISVTGQDLEVEVVKLDDLVDAGFQCISINLPDAEGLPCLLLISISWERFLDKLNASAVEVIEVNSYSSSVHVVEQLPGAAINAYASSCAFVNALALVEGRAGDVWDIKSWMGGDSERGIVPNARGYALLRRTSRSR
ncbi:hypothetical protein F751_0164 [Auxenochlorella protothecoides]|uniref:Uncharacterized protein n=2 Tax=Auxenochlorella protothecoides TaxID=3075 RepID=A0A087S9L3_AUXPR|nr:hypothetical protein F751_0164 [Auxenochlorella protothecoides]KFM22417.1 hypothetical protein F751_0164 [Auxenochlorella protothecoides]